ncbi:nucleotide-binding universal stress UspA family protein [Aneurinibacillus soli]|uniref:Universal stress protein family protein n=1 Tax=Aneurinibacillus soli TaxID=1500254 RepID=A0A0U5AST2_9BACL|nr:universal stress protein [Aneurinibacillus soli]PYE57934.1 nucleotide-binding universal stress UspA family protein [Aneurinibacillus soli]BAU26881.1 Universal stress protein family protein [Aneurinibacillus soli]
MKILIAVDESLFTKKSFEFITTNSFKDIEELHLVHVIPDYGHVVDVYPEIKHKLIEQATELLEKNLGYINDMEVIKIPEILQGESIAQCLCQYCDTHEIDLVLIGCRGLSDYDSLSLGSVSHNLVNQSKISVLIVK